VPWLPPPEADVSYAFTTMTLELPSKHEREWKELAYVIEQCIASVVCPPDIMKERDAIL
jgi:hypothetical protein